MKKFLVVVLIVAALAFLGRNLPHYSVFRLSQALEAGDLDTVMKYADLNKFAELPVDLTVEMASAGMKDAAGPIGEALAKLFGVPVGAVVKQVGGPLASQELRKRIENRDLRSLLGGFEPKTGLGWYGGVQSIGDGTAILTVAGTCPSREHKGERLEVNVGIDFSRVKGPVVGFPYDWRAMGIEANSLRQVIHDCALAF